MTLEQLSTKTHAELKEIAKSEGLNVSGNRDQLAKRLANHFATKEDSNEIPDVVTEEAEEATTEPTQPVVEPAPVVAAKEEKKEEVVNTDKQMYRLTPKNGSFVILGNFAVPPQGLLVEEGHPLIGSDYYLDTVKL